MTVVLALWLHKVVNACLRMQGCCMSRLSSVHFKLLLHVRVWPDGRQQTSTTCARGGIIVTARFEVVRAIRKRCDGLVTLEIMVLAG